MHCCHSCGLITCMSSTRLHAERDSTDLTRQAGPSPSVVLSCIPERRSKGLDTGTTVAFPSTSIFWPRGSSRSKSNDAV